MKISKKIIVIALPILLVFIAREYGIISFNYYKSKSESMRTHGLSELNSFKKVGSVEIVDQFGVSKKFHLSDAKHEMRLVVKDIFESYTWMQWVPFIKSGKSNIRCYLSVQNRHEYVNDAWDTWSKIIPIELKVDLGVYGIASAREYRSLINKSLLNFNESDFTFLK